MLNFQKITPSMREEFNKFLLPLEKGCQYSFTNLFLWGRQRAAFVEGYLVLFSQFDRKAVYPFPVGQGEILPVLDAIIHDAKARGIPCCITGLSEADKATLEHYYPGKFRFQCDRGSFDYVYNIDDLADLKGRKYQKKRNHVNRFRSLYPDWRVTPLSTANLPAVQEMAAEWYRIREESDPMGNYVLEKVALERAFAHYEALGLEGLVLMDGERVLAFTMASRLSEDTMDIHFEKAREDLDGAYAAVNCEFAAYLRARHPQLRFLNREDDMGLEGLRRAKLSYLPHHMGEKHWAYVQEDLNDL